MANGGILKELHDLSQQDPRNVPAYTFRQIMMSSQAEILERMRDVETQADRNKQQIEDLCDDMDKLKLWDRMLAVFATAIAAMAAVLGLK